MEEATVLCDRLGIFVDGQLVCVGDPKELTQRYGGYFVFTITTPPSQEDAADALVHRMCPSARLTYALAGTRKYELPQKDVSLAAVFDTMSASLRQQAESETDAAEERRSSQAADTSVGAPASTSGEGSSVRGDRVQVASQRQNGQDGRSSKAVVKVLDWGVANVTLEEVFIKFAKSLGAEGGM